MNWTTGARAIRFYREEGKGKGGPERRKRKMTKSRSLGEYVFE
jgi:hypothetical protein